VQGVDELQPPRLPAVIGARLDEMDVEVAKYYHAKALSQKEKKKAIALEKSSKKAANIDKDAEGDHEDEDEDFEEDESTVVPSAKKGAKAKGKGKTKAKAKAAAKAEAPKMKRPAAIDSAVSKFPRVDEEESVYWGGGRLYKAKGGMVRVYARTKDRKDKRFKFTDSASLNESWKKACSVIANDPRPVL